MSDKINNLDGLFVRNTMIYDRKVIEPYREPLLG